MERSLYHAIWKELSQSKDMIFLSGPRQTGKTTLAKQIAHQFTDYTYFNWDAPGSPKKIAENPTFFENITRSSSSSKPLVVFDEIHKYRKWKNYLKGIYDQLSSHYKFLALGSGRMDLFQRGGDSLAGRYFQFRVWPLTLAELANRQLSFSDFIKNPLQFSFQNNDRILWDNLSRLSGFPEPFFSKKESFYRKWSPIYHRQLVREDIRNSTELKSMDDLEVLFSLLPSRVGSPLSHASLARDIQVSSPSIQKWIQAFESFYLLFLIKPWTRKLARAITKERKAYLFDYVSISEPGPKFENMVALELMRAISNWNDLGLGAFNLHYVKNKEGEEVDFLISQKNQPFLLIETKLSDDLPSTALKKFQSIFKVPAVQLVNQPGVSKIISNTDQRILISSAEAWLPLLP